MSSNVVDPNKQTENRTKQKQTIYTEKPLAFRRQYGNLMQWKLPRTCKVQDSQ